MAEETIEDQNEEIVISKELEKEISDKCDALCAEHKIKKVFPIIIEGDDLDEKELYITYFREPELKAFSKFQSLGKSNEVQASRQLARDCYLDGDKEPIDDDSMFLYSLRVELMGIIRVRKSKIVNLSKARK